MPFLATKPLNFPMNDETVLLNMAKKVIIDITMNNANRYKNIDAKSGYVKKKSDCFKRL